MDGTAKLLSATYTKDAYGVEKCTTTAREVFCRERSITRQEFYDAGRNGLNPQLLLTVFYADYEGEALIEYKGAKYAIYRTFRKEDSDYIELYLERQGGANG